MTEKKEKYMKKLRLFALLLLITAGVNQQAKAQANPSYTAITVAMKGATAVTTGTTFTLPATGKTFLQASQLRERNKSARLYFKLDLGNDYIKNSVNWTFTVQVDLTYQVGANPSVSKTLIINETRPELLKVEDILANVNSSITINPIAVNITSVGITTSNTLLQNFINGNVRLNTTLEREYDVDVRLQTGFMANAPVIFPVSTVGRLVTFSWQPSNVDAYPNYEIQVLKMYNSDPALQTNTTSIGASVDWNRALKVETQNYKGTVKLTMAEGTGYYMWRVRPIGTYFKDGIANVENYGEWSYALPSSTATTVFNKASLQSPGNPTPYAFYFTDPDENINWIYSRVFTEGDNTFKANPTGQKTSEGITYANGLLMSRQSQKYNSSENTNIVSQTEIDYSGRPSLTTIPVPVAGHLNGYKVGFVKNSSGALYTALDFDDDAKVNNPETIKDNGANNPFSYYSSNSTIPNNIDNTNVADAEGYAFKRTLYKTDGTNRVTEESGVGKAHSLGLQTNGQGRTTRILYGTPSDDELIRVFGDEAPLASSVIKTITMDQNNVVSVTYTSKEGKTIATALISDNAVSMHTLTAPASSITVTNAISENISTGGKLVASKRIAIPDNNMTIKLSYVNSSLPGNSGTVCPTGNCDLKMRFFLTDLKQGVTYMSVTGYTAPYFSAAPGFTFPATWKFVSQGTLTPSSTITPSGANFDQITLNFGEYIITKEVFSANGPEYGSNLVGAENEKTKPVIDAVIALMQQVNNAASYNTFTTTISTLTTQMTTYNTNNNFTQAASMSMFNTLQMDVSTLPPNYVFPSAADFTIGAMTTNTADPSQANFEIVTGCCGSIKTTIPGPPICYLCDGTPDPAFTATTIAGMIAANNNTTIPITPYGINDFIADPTWTTLTTNAKVAAVTKLVEREMINPLKDRMNEEGYTAPTDLWKLMPGFSFESLNSMFANMLVSQYYTGPVVKHSDGKWYAASYNSATGGYSLSVPVNSLTNIPYNYDCKKLFDAWRSAIELINSFDVGSDDNVLTSFNSDGSMGSGQDNSEDQDNWLLDLAIVKKYLKKSFSKHLEDFADSDDGKTSGARKEAATSVVTEFMKDAGYQFAAIVDGSDLPDYLTTGTSPFPTDYVSFSVTPNAIAGTYTTITTGAMTTNSVPLLFQSNGNLPPITYTWNCTSATQTITSKELCYPYIVKPEWLFKYYVYNVYENKITGPPSINFIDDNDLLLPNQVTNDIQRKYNLPISYLSPTLNVTGDQLCSTPSALTYSLGTNTYTFNYLHQNWSSADRETFYNIIKGAPKCYYIKGIPQGDVQFNPPGPTCYNKQELYNIVMKDLDDRINACKDKRPAIIQALKNELAAACYTIVSCKTGGGQVTEKEIGLMADAVVKKAQDEIIYVKSTFTAAVTNTSNTTACANPSLFPQAYGNNACDLPACAEVACKEIVLYNTNDLDINDNKNTFTKLYRDCDQKVLDMISGGTFLPEIAPYGNCPKPPKLWTNCPDGPACSTGHPYSEKTPCSQAEYKAYSKTFTLQATGN